MHALAESSIELNDDQIEDLMQQYDRLDAFPDVAPMLQTLTSAEHEQIITKKVIFSNGTEAMVSSSVKNSPSLSPYAHHFDDIVTVDECRKFKPAPETYHHLAAKVGKDVNDRKAMGEVWLVSGNPFDVVGGRAVGMNAIWIDRTGSGWQDAMMPGTWNGPSAVVRSLEEVVEAVMKAVGQSG